MPRCKVGRALIYHHIACRNTLVTVTPCHRVAPHANTLHICALLARRLSADFPFTMSRAYVLAALLVLGCAAASSAFVLQDRVEKESWGVAPARWVRGARVSADHPIELTFAIKQTNLAELERTVLDVSDPDSPNYGKHLSLEAVDRLVAPEAKNIMAVLVWLKEAGVDMNAVEATGNSGACGGCCGFPAVVPHVVGTMWGVF